MSVRTIAGALGAVVLMTTLFVALGNGRAGADRSDVLAATHTIGAPSIRTEDGGAGCVLDGARLLCANRVTQAKTPPVALSLDAQGDADAVDAPVRWPADTPALRAGGRERLGPFTCSATALQLICAARAGGAAIGLDAGRISVSAPPAVSP